MSNMIFPQAGIITSLDVSIVKAKVFLPLFKIETDWIAVASNLLYEKNIVIDALALAAPSASGVSAGAGTVQAPPMCPGTFGAWSAAEMSAAGAAAPAGTISEISYGTLKVGDEVAVIFLNGDINQGRVIARF